MGLETPAAGLQVIQQNVQPGANYNPVGATAAMIEAFRNGQISTQDIIERQAKLPALQAAVTQATDPAQVAARRQAVIEAGTQASLQTQKEQFELKNAQDLAKIPPTVRQKAAELAQHGALDPNFSAAAYDDNQRAIIEARWNSLQDWKRQSEQAKSTLDTVKSAPDFDKAHNPLGDTPQINNRRVNDAAHSSLQKYVANYATPTSFNDWLKDGAPKPGLDLISAPKGDTVIRPSPQGGAPKLQVMPVGAPTLAAAAKLSGDVLKPGQSTLDVAAVDETLAGTPPPNVPHQRINTQSQQAAQFFLTRGVDSDKTISELSQSFDPTSVSNWAQNAFFRGPLEALKGEDLKRYNVAKADWSQGLLRLESGAAISAKEQAWYENVFFPQIGDTKGVVADKDRMRKSMTQAAGMIAANAELGFQKVADVQKNVETKEVEWAVTNALAKQSSTSTQPAKLSNGKIINTFTAKDGSLRYYPDSQSKTNKITVAPKK